MNEIDKALTTLELGFLSGRVDKDTIEKARGKVAGLGEISVHKDGSRYKKTSDGWIPVKGEKEKSNEDSITPIKQLSTGANVYHESNNVRVNDSKDGVLLNVTDKDGGMSSASVVFPSVKEAVEVAKKIDRAYPKGVPSAVDAERMVDFFRKESTPIISNKGEGFSLEINKVGGNQYLHIKHDNTGLTIKNFNSHPIASGQVKLVKEAVNDILSKVDWDVKVNQIGDSHKKAVSELDRALELDSNGRYTLSKEYLSKIK